MSSPEDLFTAGGATGRLMAHRDWDDTPLGPVSGWPQSLRAAVRMVLSSRYPMLLLWGEQYTQLYNDAYSALIGDKHPAALGGDVRITLAEGWDVLRPLIEEAMATGVASWVPALQLLLDRAGYREEAYFSVSHAPARDDEGRTVGVLTVCSEVTEQVVGERRLRLLRDLSLQGGGQTVDVAHTCARMVQAVGEHPLDVPFAAIYLRDGLLLRRVACVGTDAAGAPVESALPAVVGPAATGDGAYWGLAAAAAGERAEVVGISQRVVVPAGPWDDAVQNALALPLPSADDRQPAGVLLVGVSPSRGLDEAYRSFFHLLGQQMSVAVRNAQTYEEERRRAEALAELDRVKTSFFTNVSHEFRTPLTLLLGPLADALDDRQDALDGVQRERVDAAHRNAGRLLALVNNLLTFSSLEAGRATTVSQEIDLAAFTTELISLFRAAVERAGLRLVVDCPPLPRRVALDPANWEKIVTNLVSNALKFSFVGEIRVALGSDDDGIRLTVADTGIGIAEHDLPRLFDRFHRVHGARSRSHEGTGIGLALVRELARLQGGDVLVESRVGVGTTFTAILPWAGLQPADLPVAAPDGVLLGEAARAAAREALGWTADAAQPASARLGPAATDPPGGARVTEPVAGVPAGGPADTEVLAGARILVADDNNDMRAYLSRLLTAQGWQVEAVRDGQQALDVIRRHPPDLVLTDVMMPVLDGLQLLRVLRKDETTRALPVVVLSARAGQEADVEGLGLGADDYVVKPFAAAQLIARIRTTLQLARIRGMHGGASSAAAGTAAVISSGRALEAAVRTITEQARALLGAVQAVTVLDGADGRPPLLFTAVAPGSDEPASPEVRAEPEPPAGSGFATEPELAEAVIRGRLGRRIGAVTVHTPAGRPLPDDRQALLSPVARLLGALAEETWRLGPPEQIAVVVQRSQLPELPEIDGWYLAARHLPASAAAEAGGAWYDAIVLPDGDAVVCIGDVAGRGLGATVTAVQLREAIRAYAAQDPSPAKLLDRLDTLIACLPGASFGTLLLGHLDPVEGVLTWCSAGHPVPVRSEPGGAAQSLQGSVGPPLGALGGDHVENRVVLAPGARLLFHTDGLVQDGHRQPGEGPQRLPAVIGSVPSDTSPATLIDTVLNDAPAPRADDIAVVALERRAVTRSPAVSELADLDAGWTYPAVPTAASAMRRDLRAALGGHGVEPDLLDDLTVAASEAVNNAVEHAQEPSRPEVRVDVQVKAGTVRITVRDFGSWRGREAAMDRGRGAMLMNAYGDVRVVPTPNGTTVIIERRLHSTPDSR